MRNAFNECRRSFFLQRVQVEFPQLYAWVQWSYHCAGELRFGSNRIISTAGVQQGDPLGPLLFSLVLMDLLDDIGDISGLITQLWYLDDGTFIGTRDAVSRMLKALDKKGPEFGVYVNLSKCEVLWPSGDQAFPEFDSRVRRGFKSFRVDQNFWDLQLLDLTTSLMTSSKLALTVFSKLNHTCLTWTIHKLSYIY